LRFDLPVGDPGIPLLRQRRRLADILSGLDEDQWAAPTRCDQWSVQDVISHLIGTNQFWAISMAAGVAGEPTRFLATFDPVATPPRMVEGMRAMSSSDVLAQYVETVDALAEVVGGLDDGSWTVPAEAPPGHVPMHAVALHALWDAWIHERDIVLPLGLEPVVEDDEVAGSLVYAAALGPAFLASRGSTRRGRLSVLVDDPEMSFVVEAGPIVVVNDGPVATDGPRLTGGAVTLLEGLTFRVPLEHGLADEDLWLLGGLGEVFDVTPATTA
jgi:uncharacterized protein (TIGR03083 family)